jgi:phage/plasmid-like protein (TIGR03299 family)
MGSNPTLKIKYFLIKKDSFTTCVLRRPGIYWSYQFPLTERLIMAHELEIGQNGEVAFATLREPAWHNLGTVFNEEVSTSEMLQLAHLNDWNVRLEEIAIPDGFSSDKAHFFVARTNPFDVEQTDVLGVVGERYRVLQNEELFEFGDALLDGGGRWETAGSIKGGRQVFGSLALERDVVLDESGVADKINSYLLVNTSHDGSIAIQASVTPVRVVCANTLNLALGTGVGRNRSVKQSFKIRHTQTAQGKVQAAREALGIANAYLDQFSIMANDLIQREISQDKFWDIVKTAYPAPEKDSKQIALTKWNTKVDTIEKIYNSDTTNMIAGTAWGALNAMTERLDWWRSARGGNTEAMYASASGFDVAINAEKNRLLQVVNTLTTV